jgi:hypothetical protein
MNIAQVSDIISKIAKGFEESCMKCLSDNSGIVVIAVQEQIYSGQDGNGAQLNPTYDDDPYFEEEGYWFHRSAAYKAWKKEITPPCGSSLLGLPPRPENVPNLYINGKFFSEILADRRGDVLHVDPGSGNGPAIVAKYGDEILNMGPSAVEYFNAEYLLPSIDRFFKDCGYQ